MMKRRQWPIILRPSFWLLLLPILAIIVLLAFFGVCFLQSCYEIDTETTSGTAYGFTIGASKLDIFLAIREMPENKVSWLEPHITTKTSVERYGIDVFKPQEVRDLRHAFGNFQRWIVQGISTSQSDTVSLGFQFGKPTVDQLLWNPGGMPSRQIKQWPFTKESAAFVRHGMDYADAYAALLKIHGQSGFSGIKLRAKDQRKVKHYTTTDFQWVQQWDVWNVALQSRRGFWPDYARLFFEDEKLVRIKRIRKLMLW